jgi:predicted RNA-binding Zn ribbon-like protein
MRSAQLEGWEWLGAPLAVDLANSLVQIRPGLTRDLLASDDALDDWLEHEAGRVPRPARSGQRLVAFRGLRDAVYQLLSAAALGEPMPRVAIQTVNAASGRSHGNPRLALRGGVARAELAGAGTPLDRALAAIARSAIEFLSGPERERLRVCPAPSCGMFFLARARQKWCSTACGNRARAARHYARRRRHLPD